MLKKVFKWIAMLSQSIGIGAIALYIYAYFKYRSNWNTLSNELKSNINLYLLIGIAGLLLYIIVKILSYFVRKPKEDINHEEQVSFDFSNNEYKTNESTYEPKINETPKYVVPLDRQSNCPNCNNIVDKDAFICLHCGILLKNIETPATEKIVYKEIVKENNNENMNMFKTVLLMIVIVIGMFLAYDYTKENNVFTSNKPSESELKSNFYTLANSVITDVKTRYDKNEIKLNKNTTYFTLLDLGYTSYEYNPNKSFIAINNTDKKIYISLVGINEYENYSVNITEKKDLDITDVVLNTPTITDIENKLLIDNDNGVTIYYKN